MLIKNYTIWMKRDGSMNYMIVSKIFENKLTKNYLKKKKKKMKSLIRASPCSMNSVQAYTSYLRS